MLTRTRGSENGQRVYSVFWKAGGRGKRVRMRAWEGVLAGRPYACALTTVSMTAISPYKKRVMNDIQDGEAFS